MVVLGAAAGVAALSGTAFAGDMPSTRTDDHGHHHHHDHDKDRDHGRDHSHGGGNGNASARNGDCANFGDQLVGLNCVNVQAPINQLGILSGYDNSSDDDGGRNGNARTGGDNGGRGGDRDGGNGNASARNGDSVNFGDQLIGVNGLNAQLPINQLGLLSGYNNAS
ncbi:hypothetical protein [Actinomycetospora soli]|uniref:hypothetical protein n=1 Tax=Actinomycetospora soli TaxID=2893887 RepID=UPI001E30D32E|nr:hypothetical protein [Actinomycetospora soli]MCD2187294.1 hypothetical protein [Actinomycetospora soli]